MLTVHHLNNSRSQRVLWLLEELELPYDVKFYERDPKTLLAPPELRAVHPLGRSPVVTTGKDVLAESGAIIEYLVEVYGKGRLVPTNSQDRMRYRYWLHYAEGSAMTPLLLNLIFNRLPQGPMPFFLRPIVKGIAGKVLAQFVSPLIDQHMSFMETELNKSIWFAGDEMSAADIQMSFPVEAGLARVSRPDRYPKLSAFLDRIHSRKPYKRALAKGGPFEVFR